MSSDSRAAVAAAQAGNLGVYVSPMTAWEIATLVAKNGLQLSLSPETWFDALLGFAGVRLAPMPPKVLIASALAWGTAQGSGGSDHRGYRPDLRVRGDHP
jgi:PIN domain nuclease of toxin-antitoxin system